MKNIYFAWIWCVLLGWSLPIGAQSYDKLWNNVKELDQKDLPQSAWKETQKIFDQAKAEGNKPQMLKAYIKKMAFRAAIAPDSLQVDLQEGERWVQQATQPAEKALLCSVLGELLLNESKTGKPDSEKSFRKGFRYVQQSLTDAEVLVHTPASQWAPIVVTGKASQTYVDDNLYDLLAHRALQLLQHHRWTAMKWGIQTERLPEGIDRWDSWIGHSFHPASEVDSMAEISRIYQSLLHVYDSNEHRAAWLMTALHALQFLNEEYASFSAETCRTQLFNWLKLYPQEKTTPQIYLALINQFPTEEKPQTERLRLVREALSRFPHHEDINQLKNIEKEILNPNLSIQVEDACPGDTMQLRVGYKNLNGFTLQLYRVDLPVTSAVLRSSGPHFESKYTRLQREEHFKLPPSADYDWQHTTLTWQAPPAGIYWIKAIPDGKTTARPKGTLLYVTGLKAIVRSLPDESTEVITVDALSGQPVPHAELTTYTSQGEGYAPQYTYQADEKGTFRLDGITDEHTLYRVHTPQDTSMPVTWLYASRFREARSGQSQEVLRLFTDRSLYRPGQSVHVSGIGYHTESDEISVQAHRRYTLSLRDTNRNEIGRQEVTTNEFGSFHVQFTLPSACLPGSFSIHASEGSTTFRVEEYKRPTFEVTFDPVQTEYRSGDSLSLTGVARTFAGMPVAQAQVRYEIIREQNHFWRSALKTARWNGETQTDEEGRFVVPVRFDVPSADQRLGYWYYGFRIEASVTHPAGETRQGQLTLPLGSTSMLLDISGMDEGLIKQRPVPITLQARNLTGETVNTEIDCRVVRRNAESAEEGDIVWTGKYPANQPFVPEALYALPSGSYRLQLSAHDAQGRTCRTEKDFWIWSTDEKRPPISTTDWFYQEGNEWKGNDPLAIYIGTREKDVYLIYDVFAGNQHVESRRIHFSDSVLTFRIPYQEAYGDGILVTWGFVKRGRFYAHEARILKPRPQKESLQLKWNSFRDKLRPGQEEEWKLNVTHADGRPADAELMATLYDASLDALTGKHAWNLQPYFNRSLPSIHWSSSQLPYVGLDVNFPWKRLPEAHWEYSSLIPLQNRLVSDLFMYKKMSRSASRSIYPTATQKYQTSAYGDENVVLAAGAVMEDNGNIADVAEAEEDGPEAIADVQLRQNFQETAFFYPQLQTDSCGTVSLTFTLPESLTRWRLLALAHTRGMDYGRTEAVATASKEFMVQSHLPRFVRVGDQSVVTASLVNLSEKAISGTVRLELFQPETEKVFLSQKKRFAVAAGQTESVDFHFQVTDKHTVLACRLVAEGGNFSDGEQHYLPVLTDKQWVTETKSIYVNGKGTTNIALDELFNHHSRTASHQRLTVEFTAHPIWYAIQALPVMSEPQTDDALAWAVACYANGLSEQVVTAFPRLRQVMESWKAQGGTKETFLSQLQKNEELKEILLDETPWLAEATDEAERRQRLTTLFDVNNQSARQQQAISKLKELQQSDGSWSWWKGMSGSRYVTTHVVELLARLHVRTGCLERQQALQTLYRNGLQSLTRQAEEECKFLKEAERKGAKDLRPSESALRYLYICSIGHETKALATPSARYLTEKLAAAGNGLPIYEKALGAIVLRQAGRKELAAEWLKSVLEYSVMTDEMGRYFDTPKAGTSWFAYQIPTEVAVIEAMEQLSDDTATLNEMKRWLLKQKQTQAWASPIASADAVYALLTTAPADEPLASGEVLITLGKETIRTPEDDAAGYVKQTRTENVTHLRHITVQQTGDGIGWGAVYAQYLEDAERIGTQSNGLSVERKLYKGNDPLTDGTSLRTGEKLTVKLVVRADRNMDFVQINDERAACLEPADVTSGYRHAGRIGYYQVTKDASTRFFIDSLPKGSYEIAYTVYVDRAGTYRAGAASARCTYAPEFGGQAAGYQLHVESGR